MTPDVVVDIGNTRIKWGVCGPGGGIEEYCSLPGDDPTAWQVQADAWDLDGTTQWAVASVHPGRTAAFSGWLRSRGAAPLLIDDYRTLPVRVQVDEPARVGIDRLVNVLAAGRRAPGRPLAVASVGTAVTVDFLTKDGVFVGGAIFPGLRTMTRALHHQTAALPEVEVGEGVPPIPGKNTRDAIRAGVFWSVVGGINFLSLHGVQALGPEWPKLYLTGGDAHRLEGFFNWDPEVVPALTLEGIRLAAEALP